jgi:hypothetical protein
VFIILWQIILKHNTLSTVTLIIGKEKIKYKFAALRKEGENCGERWAFAD